MTTSDDTFITENAKNSNEGHFSVNNVSNSFSFLEELSEEGDTETEQMENKLQRISFRSWLNSKVYINVFR